MIKSDRRVAEFDAVDQARQVALKAAAGETSDVPQQSLEGSENNVMLLYRAKNGNMLTPDNLRAVRQTEEALLQVPGYRELCHLVNVTSKTCAAPISTVSLAKPSFFAPQLAPLQFTGQEAQAEIDSAAASFSQSVANASLLLADVNAVDTLAPAVYKAAQGVVGFRALTLDKDYSSSHLGSEYMRSLFPMGTPLAGYSSPDDRKREQSLEVAKAFQAIVDKYNWDESDPAGIEVVVFGGGILTKAFDDVSAADVLWAGGSIVAVMMYLWYHTASLFLAVTSMFLILLSFPIALLVYRGMMGIDFFQTLHSLSIFLIIGIGCDAVFVFVDGWHAAPTPPLPVYLIAAGMPHLVLHEPANEAEAKLLADTKLQQLQDRMAHAWTRGAKAVLMTSGTTTAAFFATAVSKIMPIATFGLFAAALIIGNYLLNITLLPALIMLHHKYVQPLEAKVAAALCCCFAGNQDPADAVVREVEPSAIAPKSTQVASAPEEEEEEEDMSPAVAVPIDQTAAEVQAGAAGAGQESARAQPAASEATGDSDDEQAELQRDEAPVDLTTADDEVVADAQLRLAHHYTGEDVEHEAAENLDDSEAHLAVANRAVEKFFRDFWAPAVFKLRYIILAGFMVMLVLAIAAVTQLKPLSKQEEWFQRGHWVANALAWNSEQFLLTDRDATVEVDMVWGVSGIDRAGTDPYKPLDKGTVVWDASFDPSSPAAQAFLRQVCLDARQVRMYKSTVGCWLEDYEDFLVAQNQTFPFVAPSGTDQYAGFVASLQAFTATPAGAAFVQETQLSIIGGRVQLCELSFSLKLERFRPYAENNPVYEAWQAFADDLNSKAPAGVTGALQVTQFAWSWMMVERAFVQSAISGIAISIAVAYVVLMIATRNLVVGSVAAFSIFGVVMCVMAVMWAQGWEMGVTESVSSVILVGLACDYSAHIAASSIEAQLHAHAGVLLTRYKRVQVALTDMGISVVAGGVTTMASAVFLFGATVIFFHKFAILILASIGFSLAWSCVFLPALLCVISPVGDRWSLQWTWLKITGKQPGDLLARKASAQEQEEQAVQPAGTEAGDAADTAAKHTGSDDQRTAREVEMV